MFKGSSAPADPLPVMEAFYSVQGEGFHQGKAAFFIRLAGCDVGCHWCDVKASWNTEGYPRYTLEQLVEMALNHPSKLVVITGGEPLMYDLSLLTKQLRKAGFAVNLETSGAYPFSGKWDWVCFSPKKFKAPLNEVMSEADELKIIIHNKNDFAWAESFLHRVRKECRLYLQPEWDKMHKMMPSIVKYIKAHPSWEISLQTHKFMDIP